MQVQILSGRLTNMGRIMEKEEYIENGEIVSHIYGSWETVARDAEGNPHVFTLHRDTYKVRPVQPDIEDLLIRRAPPLKITPSRAKRTETDHILIASIPDEQIGYRNINGEFIPMHDERAMRAARLLLKDLRPHFIVGQGDTIDMGEISRYDADSNHFAHTLQKSIDRAAEWDAELSADHPDAIKIRLAGNHDRLAKFVLKHAAQLYGLRRSGEQQPVLSTAYLVRADETGWDYVTGYPAAEFQYKDDLVFVHGDKVNSSGSTAAKMSAAYPDRNVVFGHVHRHELHARTNHRGQYFTAATFGTLARIDGVVPSYHNGVTDDGRVVERYENWQQGIGLVRDYGTVYGFEFVPIVDGIAYYNGRRYDGRTTD